MTKIGRLRIRSRLLVLFCIALNVSLSVSAVMRASEGVHHELEVAQAGFAAAVVYCQGDDRSCGLPEHDENHVIPHLHVGDVGLLALPALDAPVTVPQLIAISFAFPSMLPVDGTAQRTPDRPPRTTCI